MKKISFILLSLFFCVFNGQAQVALPQHKGKSVKYSSGIVSANQIFNSTKSLNDTLFFDSFEEDIETSGWTLVDQDGDSYNWFYSLEGLNDSYCVASESYKDNVGVLSPSNWLISPVISMPEDGSFALKLYAAAQDPTWFKEVFKVCVSTTNSSIDSFTELAIDTLSKDGWDEYIYDISQFAGEDIFIAIVHTNVTDMFALKIDDFFVYKNNSVDVAVRDISAPNHGDFSTCTLSNEETVTVKITNFGGDTISNFDLSYTINGLDTITETCNAKIAPSKSLDFSFSTLADLSEKGIYNIKVWSSLNNDDNIFNNNSSTTITNGDGKIEIHAFTDDQGSQSWFVYDNKNNVVIAKMIDGWEWNVEVNDVVCVVADTNCYDVYVYDGESNGMVDGRAYLEILYNGTQVAGSTEANSFTGQSVNAYNLGGGCAEIDPQIESIKTIYSSCELDHETITIHAKNAGTTDLTNVEVSYKVNDNEPVVEIIEETIPANTFFDYSFNTDADLSIDGNYIITVSINKDGDENLSNNSDTIYTQKIASLEMNETVEYRNDFDSDKSIQGITTLDENKDGSTWNIYFTDATHTDGYIGYKFNQVNSANDWLILQCMNFEAGDYNLSFDYAACQSLGTTYPENLKVMLGTALNDESFTTQIVDLNNIENTSYTKSSTNFNIPTEGVYYIGFYCYSNVYQFILKVDNVVISKANSVVENSNATIGIYPNPANDILNIENVENSRIQILNTIGETVVDVEKANANQRINVSGLESGIYFVKIGEYISKINICR